MDQVVDGHREMVDVEKSRMLRGHRVRCAKVLSHTRENIACAKCPQCGVLVTHLVADMGIAVACKRIYENTHLSCQPVDDHHELEDDDQELEDCRQGIQP